jgi:hypothetical protein
VRLISITLKPITGQAPISQKRSIMKPDSRQITAISVRNPRGDRLRCGTITASNRIADVAVGGSIHDV